VIAPSQTLAKWNNEELPEIPNREQGACYPCGYIRRIGPPPPTESPEKYARKTNAEVYGGLPGRGF